MAQGQSGAKHRKLEAGLRPAGHGHERGEKRGPGSSPSDHPQSSPQAGPPPGEPLLGEGRLCLGTGVSGGQPWALRGGRHLSRAGVGSGSTLGPRFLLCDGGQALPAPAEGCDLDVTPREGEFAQVREARSWVQRALRQSPRSSGQDGGPGDMRSMHRGHPASTHLGE